MKIGRSGWPGSLRNGEPRWLKKQTLPSMLYVLGQAAALMHLLCYPPLLHEWSAGHHCTTKGGHPSNHLSQRDHRPWPPQVVQFITLGLHLIQCLPCGISPLLALPWLNTHSLMAPCRKSGSTLPVAHSVINATKACINSQEVEVMSEHSSTQGDEPLDHKGRNLPVPLSVRPRPLLMLVTVQWWEPQRAPGIRTVRAMPNTGGPHPTRMHPERTWLIWIWSQPAGTVSSVWPQMR